MKKIPCLLSLIGVFLHQIPLQAQCVMCKEIAGKEDKAVGINEGILYLMAAPYLVMAAALVGYLLYRRHKKKKAISAN